MNPMQSPNTGVGRNLYFPRPPVLTTKQIPEGCEVYVDGTWAGFVMGGEDEWHPYSCFGQRLDSGQPAYPSLYSAVEFFGYED